MSINKDNPVLDAYERRVPIEEFEMIIEETTQRALTGDVKALGDIIDTLILFGFFEDKKYVKEFIEALNKAFKDNPPEPLH